MNLSLVLTEGTHPAEVTQVVIEFGQACSVSSKDRMKESCIKRVSSITDADGIYYLNGGLGIFRYLTFTLDASPILTSHVFFALSGDLTITDFIFSPSTNAPLHITHSLIHIECPVQSYLSFSASTFTLDEGDGGVLTVIVNSSSSFSIYSSTFTNCTSVTGYGGALYIESITDSSVDVTFDEVEFAQCTDVHSNTALCLAVPSYDFFTHNSQSFYSSLYSSHEYNEEEETIDDSGQILVSLRK